MRETWGWAACCALVCVRVSVCMRACERMCAWVRACVRAWVRARACDHRTVNCLGKATWDRVCPCAYVSARVWVGAHMRVYESVCVCVFECTRTEGRNGIGDHFRVTCPRELRA